MVCPRTSQWCFPYRIYRMIESARMRLSSWELSAVLVAESDREQADVPEPLHLHTVLVR